jgi:predicted nucleic acid-binding protein
LSPDLRVALTPRSAYTTLAAEHAGGPLAALGRPALVALILGTAIAVSSTHRVTLKLVASTTICWTFVVVVQLLAATVLIASARRRRVGMLRALELFFISHAPWSLWILAFAVRAALWRSGGGMTDPFLLTALVPLVWTGVIVSAFCREVLGISGRAATLRTLWHQGLIWTIAFIYVVVVVQAWPRFLNLVDR